MHFIRFILPVASLAITAAALPAGGDYSYPKYSPKPNKGIVPEGPQYPTNAQLAHYPLATGDVHHEKPKTHKEHKKPEDYKHSDDNKKSDKYKQPEHHKQPYHPVPTGAIYNLSPNPMQKQPNQQPNPIQTGNIVLQPLATGNILLQQQPNPVQTGNLVLQPLATGNILQQQQPVPTGGPTYGQPKQPKQPNHHHHNGTKSFPTLYPDKNSGVYPRGYEPALGVYPTEGVVYDNKHAGTGRVPAPTEGNLPPGTGAPHPHTVKHKEHAHKDEKHIHKTTPTPCPTPPHGRYAEKPNDKTKDKPNDQPKYGSS
ncbi:hypothetical protein BDD12DRAFT_804394 [Trichophaea hybrida]|nr:hypothetical protein BDD12DRAFT_804394 [Trichophaea hybrida]